MQITKLFLIINLLCFLLFVQNIYAQDNSAALDLTLDKNFIAHPAMQAELSSQKQKLLPGIFKDEQAEDISINGRIFTEEIYDNPHRANQDNSIDYETIDGAGISLKIKTDK